MRIMRIAAIIAGLAVTLLGRSVLAQAPKDVPQDHWAYAAVNDLASKGLIKGYPPNGDFFGKRTVTRYEMAVIIQRVLRAIDELLAKKADKGDVKPAPAGVSQAQLDEVRKLVDDFKIELTVIGTDLQKVKDQIGEVAAKADAAQRTADDARAVAGKAAADAAGAAKAAADAKQGVSGAIDAIKEQKGRIDTLNGIATSHKISGYIQARFEMLNGGSSLFAQNGAGGTGQSPTNGGPSVGGPQYGFLVRRARVKFSGPISKNTEYGIQLDAPSFTAVNVKEGYIKVANLLGKNVSGLFGQFPPMFGYEIPVSSAVRESPERALGFSDTTQSTLIFKSSQSAVGGTVTPGSVLPIFLNQEFDQGAQFTWEAPGTSGTKITLGAINGGGTVAAGIRRMSNGMDALGRAETMLLNGKLGVGISGYYGTLSLRSGPPAGTPPAPVAFTNARKYMGGADVRYLTPWGTTLRAEYVGGIYESTPDRSQYLQGNHAQAWYLTARHMLTKKLEFAVKYDEFMPITGLGTMAGGLSRMEIMRKTLQGGLLYSLDSATRFRLWWQQGLTPYDPSAAAGNSLRERMGLLSGEVQVRF